MTTPDLSIMESPILPNGLPVPLQALWWLKKGGLSMGPEWHEAHKLCQTKEGDHDFDLVHALAHWIEGDMDNATYWYRRVGGERAKTIEQEWQRVVVELID